MTARDPVPPAPPGATPGVAGTRSTGVAGAGTKHRSPWSVVVGAGLGNTVGLGPLVLTTFGLFVVPIVEASGLTRVAVTVAFTAAGVGSAVATLLAGRLVDVLDVRLILVVSWILYAGSVASVAAVPLSRPWIYVPFLAAGVFGGATFLPATKAVVSWFDNRRGLAVGILATLGAIGVAVMPLVAGALIDSVGWSTTYVILAAVALVVSLVAVIPFVRVRGQRSKRGRVVSRTHEGDREVDLEVPGLTVREALRGRHFWIIGVILCGAGAAIIGIQVNVVPMVTDAGMLRSQAALLLTVFGVASLLGRLAGGVLLDRVPARLLTAVVLLCPVAGLALLGPSFTGAAIGSALIGVAFGIEVDLLGFLVSRYVGMRRFGTLVGFIQSAAFFATAFGPLIVARAREETGSYDGVMPWIGGALVLCAVLVLFLGPYRYPAIAGFDRSVADDELAPSATLAEIARREDEARRPPSLSPSSVQDEADDH